MQCNRNLQFVVDGHGMDGDTRSYGYAVDCIVYR